MMVSLQTDNVLVLTNNSYYFQNRTRLQDTTLEVLNTSFRGLVEYIPNTELCFDGVWAFTLALNKTLQGINIMFMV